MRLSRQGDSLCVQTPAKVNLFLKVLGRRQDGYHDLQSVMVSVKLFDTLQCSLASHGAISLRTHACTKSASLIPDDERNLVFKAARLLQTETNCRSGAEISLWKRIPSEAGLGGGSSDAAATLVMLNQLWNLELTSAELHELAAKLGSDVNFFLDSPTAAVCTGRGEQVLPLALPGPLSLVIVKPPTGLSTAKVFGEWTSQAPGANPVELEQAVRELISQAPGSIANIIFNDLERAARGLNEQIDLLLSRLSKADVLACGMTGSGSACYALCRTLRQARTLASRCRSWKSGTVFTVTTGV